MKKLKSLSVIAICTAGLVSFNANASIEAALANICNIVQSDDKSELRKKMKDVRANYSLKLADYYDGISCNGNSLIRTALLSDAVEAGTLLVKKMPKSRLNQPDSDGVALTDWIASNGLESSPIAGVVQERM
ncbi:DUF3718 domain-containing protein [Glaciecola sp. XM2]|uniref:DUF3718 domain-containing protein n=1 Tax=Glaciecola sp. XM2 TaxID=1914931 RepID=UPI001BDEAE53|nr:DUF3718 domain-containing protein [Glaciecola sp. XM2]MBT1449432.1 DUF3718 domain-containing protein [Glaciecola sp. XM2]